MLFFTLSDWALALLILAVLAVVTAAGVALGRYLRNQSGALREPFGALQSALLSVVGLILAFGLTLAVGRYEDRRAAVVAEAKYPLDPLPGAARVHEAPAGRALTPIRESRLR